jgi:hypothetical protein
MGEPHLQKSCAEQTEGAEVARCTRREPDTIVGSMRESLKAALVMSMAAAPLATAAGQAAPGTPTSDSASNRQQVAVVIFAEATAKEVSFRSQPELHVRLSGGLDSVHVLDRRNLPSPVVTGTTYRDVHVAVELFGRVNAECIARTLTRGARTDCASLELRGTSGAASPPPAQSDTTSRSTTTPARPPRT